MDNTPTYAELNSFKKETLHDLCAKMKLPVSGKKADLISRLQSANISYSDLQVPHLKELCEHNQLKKGGTKEELITRLSGGYQRLTIPEKSEKQEQSNESPVKVQKQGKSLVLSKERLSIFLVEELKEWCRESQLPVGGNKSDLVDRLFANGLALDSLYKSSLKDICEAEGKPTSGTVQELIERLTNSIPVKIEKYIAVSNKKAANSQKLNDDTVKAGKQMVC